LNLLTGRRDQLPEGDDVVRAGRAQATGPIPENRGFSMNRTTLALAVTLATLSTAAVAQTAQEQQACMNDAFRVCSATIPDRNRTIACMVQHKAELSQACQMVMAKYAPAEPAPVQTAVAPRTVTRNASMKPVKTAVNTQRPGKPLNILMR
jgi:hypothetical protein